MHTWIVMVLLTHNLANTKLAETPSWQPDYTIAQKAALVNNKPLAVFLGQGKDGAALPKGNAVTDPVIGKLLATKYVCVYVDTLTPEGKRFAQAFEIDSKGVVISDKTGKLMAYHHTGAIPASALAKTLEKYSDPSLEIKATETTHDPSLSVQAIPVARPTTIQQPNYSTNFPYQQNFSQPYGGFAPYGGGMRFGGGGGG